MMERNESIDIIKGVLIILVLLGHSISLVYGESCVDNIVFKIIYSFHMPLFVFVSGYLFQKSLQKKFKDLLGQKIKRLIVPLLTASTILVIINWFSKSNFIFNTKDLKTIVLNVHRIYTTYWFLICVFVLSLIAYIYCHARIGLRICILLLWVGLFLIYDLLPFYPLKNCQILRLSLIFCLGFVLGNTRALQDKLKGSKVLLCIIAILCGIILVVCIIIYGNNFFTYPEFIRSVFGICCSFFALLIIQLLVQFVDIPLIKKVFVSWGQKTLEFYVLHIVIMKILQWNIAFEKSVVLTVMVFLLYIVVCIGCVFIRDIILPKF